MGRKEKWPRDSTSSKTTPTPRGSRRALDHAWGLPPRVVEGPARPDCGIGGHRAGANRRVPPVHTKTGVTAARRPLERTEPGNRFLAPPARGDEAPKHESSSDERLLTVQAAPHTASAPAQHQRQHARERRRGGDY